MAEVGTAVVKVVPSMSGFGDKVKSGVSDAFSSASSTASKSGSETGSTFSAGFSAKLGAVGGIASTVASKAIDVIGNSLSSAVSRVDTLNQFPKVMQQMGFSAQSAQTSIDTLSAGIQGLPTSLDTIASSTQSIALLTGDLDGATSTALALNDAFLASGSSTADAERGLTQYTQMLSKGSVDLESWRTLQETMGYALRETANAMGFTGDAAVNDLYSALQSGEVTFDEFNAKLVELDQAEGGFASTAAEASAGIQTSMDNAGTAVTRNLANIIEAFNQSGIITTFFEGFGTAVNGIGTVLTPIAETIGTTLVTGLQALSATMQPLMAAIEPMMPVLQQIGAFLVSTLVTGINLVFNVLQLGIGIITAVIVAVQLLWSGITSAFSAIVSTVTSAVSSVQGFISGAIATIQSVWSSGWSAVTSFLTSAWANISSGVSSGVSNMLGIVSSIPSRILGALGNLGSLLVSAGRDLIQGLINGITGMIGSAISAVTGAVGNIISSAKSALGIHSPSKVFKEIGYYIDAGLAAGISNYAGSPISAVADMATSISDTMSGDIDASISGTGSFVRGSNRSTEANIVSWLAANLGSIIAASAPQTIIDNDAGALIVDNRLQQLQRRAGMNVG